jgi:hypothetical protein
MAILGISTNDRERLVVRADDSKRLWRNDNLLGILEKKLNDCGELGIKRGLNPAGD